MSPPLLGVGEEEGQSNVTILASSASMESVCQISSGLKERNYMGLSECSSVDSSAISTDSDGNKSSLNLKATELRLGLPGSLSPGREPELCLLSSTKLDEKPLFPLHPSKDLTYTSSQKTVVSGNKRGFADAMNGFSEGKFLANSEVNVMLSPRPSPNKENLGSQPAKMKEMASPKIVQERPRATNETPPNHTGTGNNSSSAPATKAQVVGWPPIRSFRKNTLATTSKNTEVDGKAGPGALFVKVSMDGAPYLRKVDLRNYSAYQELSSALEKMFSCFTIGQYGSHGAPGREMLSESKLKDLLHGSEYVLTYEDKDGDWMLVGDVPWQMFIETCKRLRIMKSCDAIGLAPRAVEKCKNRN
ncbi:Aux/IAA protein [Vitis vinifera]|uniref:Auxin-responsive protein n=1 Tax=Vitis vinifera TaxID=29760 RepID=G9JTT0_VITVI|nr:Aux/IAA protein [Vitis vinifera]AEV89794.1 indole-3-acetic acid-induced protein 4 [Vitis vinifera]|eukprot:NP_001268170.1 Aux/IAA protein [Vitis vinifera]